MEKDGIIMDPVYFSKKEVKYNRRAKRIYNSFIEKGWVEEKRNGTQTIKLIKQ